MRSIEKAVRDYEALTDKKNVGAFYASDFYQIYDIAKTRTDDNDIFTAITTALKAGFMIGYRTAKRGQKQCK